MPEIKNDLSSSPSLLTANTRPTKKLLVDGITRDLTIEACIFDLIDNAIDAKKDELAVLIEIVFDGLRFSIKDNGSGISLNDMSNSALRFGAINPHFHGIGAFGIGLNRALFKLGKTVKLGSETSHERVSVNWDIVQYIGNNDDWEIPIIVAEKTGELGTFIEVSDLNDDVSSVFSNKNWEVKLISELSRRYGFLIKDDGFCIKVNGNDVAPSIPMFRQTGRFKLENKTYTNNGISITIELGQHYLHNFSDEPEYDDNQNKKLTPDFGWTVYCNNRAILLSDWTHKTGWDTGDHTQYYGFVGIVHFKGDSNKLPWSTSKDDVDLHNVIYADALKTMRQYSQKWRSHTNQVKNGKLLPATANPQLPLAHVAPSSTDTSATSVSDTVQNNESQIKLEDLVTTQSTTLQSSAVLGGGKHNVKPHPVKTIYLFGHTKTAQIHFKVPHSATKIKAVVNELQKLEIDDYPCAVMLLLRVLVEESCKLYKSKNLDKPDIQKERGSLAKTVMAYVLHMEKEGELSSRSDGHKIANIKALCGQRGEQVISIEYLQVGIHSSHSFLGSDAIRTLWRDIEPFVVACFK